MALPLDSLPFREVEYDRPSLIQFLEQKNAHGWCTLHAQGVMLHSSTTEGLCLWFASCIVG